jgi:aspergillopepsin I
MHFLSAAIAVFLLSSEAKAYPKPSDHFLSKRATRVPAKRFIPKRTEIRSRDGAILHKPHQKRNGAVYLDFDGGGWILPVNIGGQTVTLNIDTGSSDLWTASTSMPSDQQSTVTSGEIYDPSSSSSFVNDTGYTYGLYYADGSGSSGYVGIDIVDVGGSSVTMPFGVCDSLIYGSGESSRDTDGPLGMGFGVENSIRPTPQCTFMECVEPYVDQPIFCTSFKTGDKGFLDIGYADTTAYTGALTVVPIANTSSGNEGQWVVQGVTFGSGSTAFSNTGVDMDFDSGTASLSVPQNIADSYFALVEGGDFSTQTYTCGATLPEFTFFFSTSTSGPSSITISGSALMNGDASSGTCDTWVGIASGRANAGLPFYISEYMIWNQAEPSLSFATQA